MIILFLYDITVSYIFAYNSAGKGYGLKVAIHMLECMKKPELAKELEKKCKRGNNQ